jgi:hypothetical protein
MVRDRTETHLDQGRYEALLVAEECKRTIVRKIAGAAA